jgi:hypothetical protein
LNARVTGGTASFDRGVRVIEDPHIERRPGLMSAAGRVTL